MIYFPEIEPTPDIRAGWVRFTFADGESTVYRSDDSWDTPDEEIEWIEQEEYLRQKRNPTMDKHHSSWWQ